MLLMFFATVANASPSVLQDRKCKILFNNNMCVLGNQILVVWLPFFYCLPVFVVSLREGTMWTTKVRQAPQPSALNSQL